MLIKVNILNYFQEGNICLHGVLAGLCDFNLKEAGHCLKRICSLGLVIIHLFFLPKNASYLAFRISSAFKFFLHSAEKDPLGSSSNALL